MAKTKDIATPIIPYHVPNKIIVGIRTDNDITKPIKINRLFLLKDLKNFESN